VPGGMFFSGLFFGVFILFGIIIGCIIVTAIINVLLKKVNQLKIFYTLLTISFLYFHYFLYSPTLKITVPKGFSGYVYLKKSYVNKNQLILDSTGIGEITEWTFNKAYSKPIVVDTDGNNLDAYCVGYSNTSFYGKSVSTSSLGSGEALSFQIYAPSNLKNQ
jgi:hypothetical protein